jgi:hypothetical protein
MELRPVLWGSLAAFFFGALGCAHGGPPKGPGSTGAVATSPRAVSADAWAGLCHAVESAQATDSKPSATEVSSESGFVDLFGCASGVDWSTERLVLLLLEVRHMDAIRVSQLTLQNEKLRLRIRVDCGAGYDDHFPAAGRKSCLLRNAASGLCDLA